MPKKKTKTKPSVAPTESLKNVEEQAIVSENVAAIETVAEPAATEPVAEEPVAEEPVAEEPVATEPVAEEPVAEEPDAEDQWIKKKWTNGCEIIVVYYNLSTKSYSKIKPRQVISSERISRIECQTLFNSIN